MNISGGFQRLHDIGPCNTMNAEAFVRVQQSSIQLNIKRHAKICTNFLTEISFVLEICFVKTLLKWNTFT
jgi:hypothetical protein